MKHNKNGCFVAGAQAYRHSAMDEHEALNHFPEHAFGFGPFSQACFWRGDRDS